MFRRVLARKEVFGQTVSKSTRKPQEPGAIRDLLLETSGLSPKGIFEIIPAPAAQDTFLWRKFKLLLFLVD